MGEERSRILTLQSRVTLQLSYRPGKRLSRLIGTSEAWQREVGVKSGQAQEAPAAGAQAKLCRIAPTSHQHHGGEASPVPGGGISGGNTTPFCAPAQPQAHPGRKPGARELREIGNHWVIRHAARN